mmetsp:Transcript_5165/g.19333  ORF Transcript_5165/g.19333 Transcript_5165/m.19333 type:complete len:228 (+) Transcript_5165:4160-4843(+)
MKLTPMPSTNTDFTRALTSIPGRSVPKLVVSVSCVTAFATRFGSAVTVSTFRLAGARRLGFLFSDFSDSLVSFSSSSFVSRSAPVNTTSSKLPCTKPLPGAVAFRGKKPGGAPSMPKLKTKPWSSTETTSAGTLTPSARDSFVKPAHVLLTRVVKSILLPPLLPFSSLFTTHRTSWPTWKAACRDKGGAPVSSSESEDSESDFSSSLSSSSDSSFIIFPFLFPVFSW